MKKNIYLFFIGVYISQLLSFGQTGFTENFETDPEWGSNEEYTAIHKDSIEQLVVNKSNAWRGLQVDLPDIYDISLNPYINLKVLSDPPVKLFIYLFDSFNNYDIVEQRVPAADDFINICYDFSGASSVDLTQVTAIVFCVNCDATSYTGNVYFDDLLLGSDAIKMANIGGVKKQVYYKNTSNHSILITDIDQATSVTATGGGSLLQNIDVTSIRPDNTANLTFDLVTDATGKDEIIITANGITGWSDNSYTFNIEIEDNNPPTLDTINNTIIPSEITHTIILSGISDGNIAAEQNLTLTAHSDMPAIIPDPVINYEQGSPYAGLLFTSTDTISNVNITITIEDEGDGTNSITKNFLVSATDEFNYKPTIDQPNDIEVRQGNGEHTVNLVGISDGNNGTQNMTITASSADSSVVSNDSIQFNYDQGNATADLIFNPGSTGTTTITIELKDNGGTTNNNGDKITRVDFDIKVLTPVLTGHVVPTEEFDTIGNENFGFYETNNDIKWRVEGNFTSQTATSPGTYHGKDDVIKIELNDKACWTGLWYDCPELDMSRHPYMCYDIYFEGASFETNGNGKTHAYFWDNNMHRNVEGAHLERDTVLVGTWQTALMDFREEGKIDNYNDEGEINIKHIQKILFNYATDFSFPSDNGTVYITNILLGSAVPDSILPAYAPPCTIDPIPNQTHYTNAGQQTLLLTGISDGVGNTTPVTLTATSNNSSLVPDPTVSLVNGDGEAILTYSVSPGIDSAEISVTANAPGANNYTTHFKIFSTDSSSNDILLIDCSVEYQTIKGFGTDLPENRFIGLFTDELGASAVRIKIMDNQIEPVNDNNDPDVLYKPALNNDAFDWDYLKNLKAKGIETFILSSYSPPAWMKDNFSINHFLATFPYWEDTDNRLSIWQYEEFAENIAAVVKLFKEEAGIELYAISLQNKPFFCQKYASAILSPAKFADLIKIVGQKFENENIETKLMMPEQVFEISSYSMADYMDSVQADPIANQCTDIFAVHDYDNDGMAPGSPDFTGWTNMWNNAQQGAYPKELWMTYADNLSTDWQDAMSLGGAMYGAFSSGNVSLWNWGPFNNTFFKYDDKTPLFTMAKHFYKFIKSGAVRLSASCNDDIMVLTFKNDSSHDNKIIIEILNKGYKPYTVYDSITNGEAPNNYMIYQSSENKYFEALGSKSSGANFIVPPRSITTLIGANNLSPTIDEIPEQYVIAGEGEKTINLSGITDGGDSGQDIYITAKSSDDAVISNVNVNYTSPGNTAQLYYTAQDAPGESATITVTVKDDGGGQYDSAATSISFNVNVYSDFNDLPEIDPVSNQVIFEDAALQTILLTGINDGDEGTQSISITASSSNLSIIPDPSVAYTQSDNTATLSYLPASNKYGLVTITLLVEDDGGSPTNNGDQSFQEQFIIEVEPVNDPPTIDPVQNDTISFNDGVQQINLSGIYDGDYNTQNITLTASATNPDIITIIPISYTQGETTATLAYSPEKAGETDVSIKLKDDGGTSNGGVDTSTTTFTIKVLDNYDVTFNVSSSETSLPINNAEVFLNGHGTQFTNTNGQTIFNDITPESNISYNISATGYNQYFGILSVTDTNIIKNIFLSEIDSGHFNVTFTVVDSSLAPIEGAQVTLDGYGNKITNSEGKSIFENIEPAMNIDYTITMIDYYLFKGTINISDSDIHKQVQLLKTPPGTQSVIFYVIDKQLNELSDVSINLESYGSKKTGQEGKAMFQGIYPDNAINYYVYADGYVSQNDTLTVSDTTVYQQILLQKGHYSILFVVTCQRGLPVENAMVQILNRGTKYTDQTGQVQFDSLPAHENYIYSVNADRHKVVIDTVKSLVNNSIEQINLFRVTINEATNKNFIIYPNPADEFLFIKHNVPIKDIKIMNIIGNIVVAIKNINMQTVKLQTNELKPGFYTIFFADQKNKYFICKIMIIH